MDNTKLIAEARVTIAAGDYNTTDVMQRLLEALEAAEAELTRRETLLRRAIQAGRDMHPIYGSTAACGGGIGGQAMTQHCAVVCENPKHDEAKEAWHQIERDFFALAAPVSLEAVKAETTTEWGIEYGPLDWSPRPVLWMRDEASCARFLADPPLWSTPLHTQNAVIVHRQSATPWRPVETEGDNRG